MLNDASVASAGSYVSTCRIIRNSKKIATIRYFHQNICVNPTSMADWQLTICWFWVMPLCPCHLFRPIKPRCWCEKSSLLKICSKGSLFYLKAMFSLSLKLSTFLSKQIFRKHFTFENFIVLFNFTGIMLVSSPPLFFFFCFVLLHGQKRCCL